MLCTEPCHNSRSMKEFVDQRVDGDHAATRFMPMCPCILSGEQNACQGQAEYLVGNSVDMAKRAKQRLPHYGDPFRSLGKDNSAQLRVDPIDQVGIGYVMYPPCVTPPEIEPWCCCR